MNNFPLKIFIQAAILDFLKAEIIIELLKSKQCIKNIVRSQGIQQTRPDIFL